MNATKNGISNCPNCKAIDEVIMIWVSKLAVTYSVYPRDNV